MMDERRFWSDKKRLNDFVKRQSAGVDWERVDDNLVTQWYGVSKIMGRIIPKSFPFLTFEGLVEEIGKDPNFKKEGS